MILNEQKYNRTTRLWYHGSNHDTPILKIQRVEWPFVCLTSDIEYAFYYTKIPIILTCTLKSPLNIFNALSKIDVLKLKKVHPEITNEDIKTLQERDWFEYNGIRTELAYKIIKLGYDGFANFEDPGQIHSYRDNASIAIFKPENIQVRKVMKFDDLIEYGPSEKVIKDFQSRIEAYIEKMALKYQEDISDIEEFRYIFYDNFKEKFNIDPKSIGRYYGKTRDEVTTDLYDSYQMKCKNSNQLREIYERAFSQRKQFNEYLELD